MQDLYLDTFIIGYTVCRRINILNKLKLQKEIAKIYVKNAFWQKIKTQKSKHEIPCQRRKLNAKRLAPQSGVLHLGQGVNLTYRLKSRLRCVIYMTNHK